MGATRHAGRGTPALGSRSAWRPVTRVESPRGVADFSEASAACQGRFHDHSRGSSRRFSRTRRTRRIPGRKDRHQPSRPSVRPLYRLFAGAIVRIVAIATVVPAVARGDAQFRDRIRAPETWFGRSAMRPIECPLIGAFATRFERNDGFEVRRTVALRIDRMRTVDSTGRSPAPPVRRSP
jgi:hypothetical protein